VCIKVPDAQFHMLIKFQKKIWKWQENESICSTPKSGWGIKHRTISWCIHAFKCIIIYDDKTWCGSFKDVHSNCVGGVSFDRNIEQTLKLQAKSNLPDLMVVIKRSFNAIHLQAWWNHCHQQWEVNSLLTHAHRHVEPRAAETSGTAVGPGSLNTRCQGWKDGARDHSWLVTMTSQAMQVNYIVYCTVLEHHVCNKTSS